RCSPGAPARALRRRRLDDGGSGQRAAGRPQPAGEPQRTGALLRRALAGRLRRRRRGALPAARAVSQPRHHAPRLYSERECGRPALGRPLPLVRPPPRVPGRAAAGAASDTTPWAMLTLWRHEESDPFTTAETELMGSLSQPLGASVRRAVRESLAASVGGGEPPGVLTFDQGGCLLSLNAHAGAWLEQLPRQELVPTGFGLSV